MSRRLVVIVDRSWSGSGRRSGVLVVAIAVVELVGD
jgi:hypothetical protein